MQYRYSRIVFQAFVMSMLASAAVAQNAADVGACNAGQRRACESLAIYYREGEHKDPAKAIEFLAKACDLNSTPACNNAGVAWSTGTNGASQVDHKKAFAYYKKACDLANGLGCFNAGNVYRMGEGVPVDLKPAFAYFKKSCDLGQAKGCTELAILYFDGQVVPRDVAMTTMLLEKACKLGSPIACQNSEKVKALK
jgi:uncharacterized protein